MEVTAKPLVQAVRDPSQSSSGVKTQPWTSFCCIQRSLRCHNRFPMPASASPGRSRFLGWAQVGALGGKGQSIVPLLSGQRNPTVPRCQTAWLPLLCRSVLTRQPLVLCLCLGASPAVFLGAAGVSRRKIQKSVPGEVTALFSLSVR